MSAEWSCTAAFVMMMMMLSLPHTHTVHGNSLLAAIKSPSSTRQDRLEVLLPQTTAAVSSLQSRFAPQRPTSAAPPLVSHPLAELGGPVLPAGSMGLAAPHRPMQQGRAQRPASPSAFLLYCWGQKRAFERSSVGNLGLQRCVREMMEITAN